MEQRIDARDHAARYIALRMSEMLPASQEVFTALINQLQADELGTFIGEQFLPTLRAYGVKDTETLEELAAGVMPRTFDIQNAIRHTAMGSSALMNTIIGLLQTELRRAAAATQPEVPILNSVAERLNVDTHDLRVLTTIVLLDERDELEAACKQVSTQRDIIRALAAASDSDPVRFARSVGGNAPLVRLGLIDRMDHIPNRHTLPGPEDLLRAVIFSDDPNILTSETIAPPRAARFSTDEFDVPTEELTYLSRALERGGPVLLVGTPGVGKTEFSHALCAHLRRHAASLRYDGQESNFRASRPVSRLRAVRRAAALLDPASDILLVDEADSLLQSAGGFFGPVGDGEYDKAELNALLEELAVPSVWIANDVDRVPHSSLRRFAHVYAFPRPSASRRERMLIRAAAVHECELDRETASHVAAGYALTPAAIDRMFRVIDAEHAGEEIPRYIKRVSSGPFAPDCRELAAVSARFDPGLCNASLPLERVAGFSTDRAELGKATRLLFDGPPGGGKTQGALYLAAQLGREAVLRRPSDILSMWVGGTEANIARVFQEAEDTQAVLILDEADALLGDRRGAQRSWELSQAAEFLQRIEQFGGLLIACTNRAESIDPAIRRRFHRRVTFGPLTTPGLDDALQRLAPQVTLTDAQRSRLHGARSIMLSDIAYAVDLLETADAAELVELILSNAGGRDMSRPLGFR